MTEVLNFLLMYAPNLEGDRGPEAASGGIRRNHLTGFLPAHHALCLGPCRTPAHVDLGW